MRVHNNYVLYLTCDAIAVLDGLKCTALVIL